MAAMINDAGLKSDSQQFMKAAMIFEYRTPYKLVDDIPVPEAGPNQLRVRITASALCMSDLMGIEGHTNSPLPYCGGHEPVGVVDQIGPGIKGFKVGDRVGFMPASRTCNDCASCLSGNHRYCPEKVSVGFDGPYGGFSQYCIADPLSTVKIPDGLSDQDAAPLCCAGVTAYGAIKKVAQRQVGGSLVNVVGCGGVGHLVIMYAKAMGFRVHAFDVAEDKLELARQCGADAVFNSSTTPIAEIAPASSTIVVSGAVKAYEFGLKITNTCGAVVGVGAPHEALSLDVTSMILQEVSLLTTNQGTKQEFAEAVQLAADKGVKPVIQTRHIDEINSAVDDMRAGKIAGRVVFEMWK